MLEDLNKMTDDQLRELKKNADSILKKRAAAEKRKVKAKLRKMAKDAGLQIEVKDAPKRTGRSPKSS